MTRLATEMAASAELENWPARLFNMMVETATRPIRIRVGEPILVTSVTMSRE